MAPLVTIQPTTQHHPIVGTWSSDSVGAEEEFTQNSDLHQKSMCGAMNRLEKLFLMLHDDTESEDAKHCMAYRVFDKDATGLLLDTQASPADHFHLEQKRKRVAHFSKLWDYVQQCMIPATEISDLRAVGASTLEFTLLTLVSGHRVELEFRAQTRLEKIVYLEHVRTEFVAIQGLKTLYGLFGADYDYEKFFSHFAALVDERVTALAVPADGVCLEHFLDQNKRVELSFDDMYDFVLKRHAKISRPIEILEMVPLENGVISYTVVKEYLGHQISVTFQAWTTGKGKIIRMERTSATLVAVEKLKRFTSLFDGSEYVHEHFFTAYEHAFDEDLTVITFAEGASVLDLAGSSRRKEFDFSSFYEKITRPYAEERKHMKILRVSPRPEGKVMLEIEKVYEDQPIHLFYIADTRNGKFVHFEIERAEVGKVEKPKVSGQVPGRRMSMRRKNTPSGGFSSEEQNLGNKVLSLPPQANRKHLCEGTDIQPCHEVGDVIKVFLMQEQSVVLSRNFRFTLTTAGRNLYANGACIRQQKRVHQDCFVMNDSSGVPVVLCLQDRRGNRKCTIFGRYPLNEDDEPHLQEDDQDWFPWYQVSANRMMGDRQSRPICAWNGSGFDPMMAIHCSKSGKKAFCSVTSLADEKEEKNYASIKRYTDGPLNVWNVTIAPGMDPALILLLTTIAQDFMFRGSYLSAWRFLEAVGRPHILQPGI